MMTLKIAFLFYEIELNEFTYIKYPLTCKREIILCCNDFLIKNRKFTW
jgi:hypothetical protein